MCIIIAGLWFLFNEGACFVHECSCGLTSCCVLWVTPSEMAPFDLSAGSHCTVPALWINVFTGPHFHCSLNKSLYLYYTTQNWNEALRELWFVANVRPNKHFRRSLWNQKSINGMIAPKQNTNREAFRSGLRLVRLHSNCFHGNDHNIWQGKRSLHWWERKLLFPQQGRWTINIRILVGTQKIMQNIILIWKSSKFPF